MIFEEIKKETIQVAKELYYTFTTIEQLEAARTEGELYAIMATARHAI